ncbi:serine/arginine repetitive matrix protein 1-like [Pongo abelii]|uniref:serine/arginine repetitive matrix protein 1-like n=1 Tax=Pongo abelii TaxID=9601 RepID=UPI0023E83413|nr:serine/arginine repetitive matrix protein 1-like [Pongo abelii]
MGRSSNAPSDGRGRGCCSPAQFHPPRAAPRRGPQSKPPLFPALRRPLLIDPARRRRSPRPHPGPRGPSAPARRPGPARRRETPATPSPGPAPPSLRPARSRADPSIRRGHRAPQVPQTHSPRRTSHHPGSLGASRAAGSEGLAALWRRRGRSRNVAERPSMVPGPPESVVRFFLWFCFLLPPTRKASCDPRDLKSCNRPCVWSRLLKSN